MFAKIISAGIYGVQGFKVETEIDSSTGFPAFNMVGALSKEARESRFRVGTALKNSGYTIKPKRYTVNLSPAGINKDGTGFDLSIAVAVLLSDGIIKSETADIIKNYAFIGELGLNGEIKPVRGVLPMAVELKKCGVQGIVTAAENAEEAALSEIPDVIGVSELKVLIGILKNRESFYSYERHRPLSMGSEESYDIDFSEVRGQNYMKRAVEIAASGGHNILISGPAGTGKTMIASRIPTILPRLTREENIKISEIYSICGLLPHDRPLLSRRPFRAPHHSVTPAALAGGGINACPGELSLASKGVLFLDELPLFSQNTIEILRQPLESKRITVTRLKGVFDYPADFLFAAAMNPCPCGFFPDRERCRCTDNQIRAYQSRLSKPVMERIDICAKTRIPSFDELRKEADGECSARIRERVEEVRERQKKRFEKIKGAGTTLQDSRDNADVKGVLNGELGASMTLEICRLGYREEEFLKDIFNKKGLSVRLYHKVLRLARTIADMDKSDDIGLGHLAEAVGLRNGDEGILNNGNR